MYALFKHNLFKITPVAHETIIKNMDVGVVVTNNKFEIIDYNPFMADQFEYDEKFIGKKLENKDPVLHNKLINYTIEKEEQNLEFQKYEDLSKYYKLKISSLNEDKGYIIIVYDITSQKILEEELFFKATKDFLTKTSNRYEYFGKSEKEFEVSRNSAKNLSVIMIDIDDFKEINDKYGHSAGDYVLESFSTLVKSLLPDNSIFGRLGGEEFSIVLTDYDLEKSKKTAEKIRIKIEENPAYFMGEKINYTISLGISSLNEKVDSFDRLLKSSDDALYRAKNMGKNCISI
jgi:diguanylate cyclase (GGDEF)-like protein